MNNTANEQKKTGANDVPAVIKPDPKRAAQEEDGAVHRITPGAAEQGGGAEPDLASMGNRDTMSRQQQGSMPSVGEVQGVWKQQVGAAKITWGKLTDDELLQTEGHVQKLAGLVQERYAVTRDEAEAQIKGFFARHKNA